MRRWNGRLALLAAAAAIALVVAAAVAADAAESASAEVDHGITVTGTGEASARPDRAELSFGVVTEAKTARAALVANSAAARRVIDALRELGVSDLQTESFSLWPRQDSSGERVGYTAHNSVRVRVRELDRAGIVIDTAVEAGADTVSGPMLQRGDRSELYRAALRAAHAEARAKAQTIAAAAGVALGRVVRVVEGSVSPPVPVPLATAADSAARTVAPIEPGEDRIEATVTVTFAVP